MVDRRSPFEQLMDRLSKVVEALEQIRSELQELKEYISRKVT